MTLEELRKEVRLENIRTIAIEDKAENNRISYEVVVNTDGLSPTKLFMNSLNEIEQKFLDEINICKIICIDLTANLLVLERTDNNVTMLRAAADKFAKDGYKFKVYVN